MHRRIISHLVLAGLVWPVALAAQDRRETLLWEGTYDVRSAGDLTVDLGDMDIDVRTGSGTTAVVRVFGAGRDPAWVREIFERMRFAASAAGGNLHIETQHVRIEGREWRDRGWVSHRAEVTIPARFDLDLRTGDGDISIGSVEGTLVAHTGDGDIAIGRMSGPRIELTTGDGDVTAEGLEADEIRLDTGDGDLVLSRVAGPVIAQSGDGDIELDILRYQGVSVQTGDGDVSLSVDRAIAADVEIQGEDVDLGAALTVSGRVREGRVTGSLNGGGPLLSIRTGDGSVTLRTR